MAEVSELVQPKDASLTEALQDIASGDVMQVTNAVKSVSTNVRASVPDNAAKIFVENFVVGIVGMRKAVKDNPWTQVDANQLKTNLVDLGVLKTDQMPSFSARIKGIFAK